MTFEFAGFSLHKARGSKGLSSKFSCALIPKIRMPPLFPPLLNIQRKEMVLDRITKSSGKKQTTLHAGTQKFNYPACCIFMEEGDR